ncbi:MAG: site-specific integrase [Myxococcales bacterium]|nr:site-specific integrase [Myxococcales bacterium]
MRKRPKGRKYRSLVARRNVIWVEFTQGGERYRESTSSQDWDYAAEFRDEMKRNLLGLNEPVEVEPTFAEFAARYLDEAMSNLADTTKHDRKAMLDPDGPILSVLGLRKLSQIDDDALLDWWNVAILAKRRSVKTGKNLLGALSQVLRYARTQKLISGADPTKALYETLSEGSRTKARRAEEEPRANPIEDPDDIERLLEASRTESLECQCYLLLCLDAGLRSGEARGLQWGDITWGAEGGPRRLWIRHNLPRGGTKDTTPKSGRARKVALSYRLREVLTQAFDTKWQPGPTARVLDKIGYDGFRYGPLRRMVKKAGVREVHLKDLRDTFASQLLTCGIPIQYISQQLGHADIGTTQRHYAKWIGDDEYREPMRLGEGEVPADLLAQLTDRATTKSTTRNLVN